MCVHSLAKSVSVWCIQCQLNNAVFAKVFACSAALRALHAIPVSAVTSGQCSLTCPQDEIHFPALSAGTCPNDGQRWQQLGQKKWSTQAMCAWSSTLQIGPKALTRNLMPSYTPHRAHALLCADAESFNMPTPTAGDDDSA